MNHFRTLFFLLIVILPLISKAGIVPVPQGKIFTPTSGSTTVTIGDPTAQTQVLMPTPTTTQYLDRYKRGVVTFGVDHHYGLVFQNSRIEIKVKLQRYATIGSSVAMPDTVLNMAISYSPLDSLSFEDRHSISFDGIEKYSMTLEEIKVNGTIVNILPANLYIHGDLFIDRIYDFVPYVQDAPLLNAAPIVQDTDSDNIDDQIKITWSSVQGAQEYQLEWAYINNYGNNLLTPKLPSELEIDFKHNSTRVSTSNTNYTISLAFDRGYICYRVRALGRSIAPGEMNKIIFGEWTTNQDFVTVDQIDHYQILVPFEVNKNWQYSTTYAEEGKKKEVVAFFDGSLRNRQMVTKVNSDNNTIVGETIYDHQGRPTVQVLPTPVKDPISSQPDAESSLKYYPNFTQNETGTVYTRANFDVSPSGDTCTSQTFGMGTNSGASNYYSGDNPDLNGSQGYLPDAEKYPFSQVEYTPDNTGRIRRQGGFGEEFQLNSGHETKYFYSHPFQFQLDRLFGSEVGDAAHYQKNMVIDPNGQVSVSYLDQEGRVVATSLAGDVPGNLIALPSASTPQQMVVDLFAKNSQGVSQSNQLTIEQNATYFNQTISLSSTSDLEFDYTLSIDPFTDPCFQNICFTCVYDLAIEIRNDCGLLLSDPNLATKKAGRFQLNPQTNEVEFYLDCPTGSNFIQNEPLFIEDVPVGTYQITKKLTVNEEALAFYLNAYLDSNLNTCFSTLYETTVQYMDNTDFTDCEEETDCQACVAALGTMEEFISQGLGNQEDYNLEVSACQAPCTPISYCEVQKGFLLSDVRPGGQYAQYENLTGGIQPSNFPLSIFNTANLLPISIGGSQPDATWKNPKLIIDGQVFNEYRDEDLLTRSKIEVEVTFVGSSNVILSTSPQIQTPVLNVNIFEDAATGGYYSWPEQLANVSDFIFAYQANGSWANSLLAYHPEYSYYRTCLEYTKPIQTNDAFTSESFDQQLQTISTWQGAVDAGFIKPNWASINNVNDRLTDYFSPTSTVWDPFGVYYTSNFGGSSNELQEELLNYQSINGVDYSIMEFAAIITRCGSSTIGVQPTATCGRFGDDVQLGNNALNTQTRDDEWMMFRGLYLSIKQQLQLKVARTRALTDANFYGYNGCIDNTSFNPWRYEFLDYSPFGTSSQYFNQEEQPCSYATRNLYKYKEIRFGNPLDQYSQTANQIAYQNYLLTGECPSIQAVEATLNETAATSQLNNASFTFSNLASFSGLDLTLNDFVAQSPLPVVIWDQVTSTSQVLEAELNESVGFYGTISLKKLPLEPVVFTWSDVVGFHSMNYTGSSGGDSQFTIKAQVQTVNGIVTVNLTGATSLELGECRFEEECVASELGEDLELFVQTIAGTGQLTNTSGLSVQGTSNPYDLHITDKIQLAASNNLTSTMFWKYDQSLPGFDLYETNINERLTLKINDIEPSTFNLNNLSAVISISELLVGQNNTFSLVCNDASGNYLVTLKCDAIYHNGSTASEVVLGECDLPTPLMCEGVEFENLDNIYSVLSDVLVNQTSPYNLMSSASYSSDLTTQFPINTTQITGTIATNGTIETLTFDVPSGCPITLSIETTQNSAASFSNINLVQSINVIGDPNNYSTYNNFELQVNFELSGNSYSGIINGQTCLPLQACNGCLDSVGLIDYTAQQLDSISNKQFQDGIVYLDGSVENYELYTTEIDTLNSQMGWTSTDSLFVESVGYEYFFKHGISYPITSYIRFVRNFDPQVDSHAYLTDPLSYIKDYGHATNVKKEYQRYLTAVDNYNSQRVISSLSTTIPVTDNEFAMTIYPDTLNQYIAYLNDAQNDVSAAMPVDEYPTIQTAEITDGDCKNMYQQYVLAYEQFEQQQSISNTCLNYQVSAPFVSYQVFVDNNLCCSTDGFAAFQNYVASFSDTTTCPGSVPYKESCITPVEPNTKDCQRYWARYSDMIEQFNQSLWAQQNNQQLIQLYPNFNSFLQTGKCNCILFYIRYLNNYIVADSSTVGTLPGPVYTIDEYCPSAELVPENSPCETAYDNYLNCIGIYNQWAITEGEDAIVYILKIEEFFKNDLCSCVDAYCSTLNSIMDGFIPTDQLPDLLTICNQTTKPPCSPNLPLVTNIEIPSAVFIDPCTEFYTNTSQSNALNAYNIYIQNLTTEFSQRYIEHCMSATEDFTMTFSEIEHHFTLYYYDQAGNLIKTVPPEGVEMLNVADPLILGAVALDRDNGTHNVQTSHRLATTYQYNSLNQLVSQSMPDQDKMDIFEITLPNGLSSRLETTSIQMISSNVGYLTGFVPNSSAPQLTRGYLYRTENGGTNWQRVNYTLAANVKEVKMVNNLTGFAIGEAGVLLKTTDGGISWDLMDTYSLGVISPITAIAIESPVIVRVASKNGDLIKINGANLNVLTLSAIPLPAGTGIIVNVNSMYSVAPANYMALVSIQTISTTYDAILNVTGGSSTIEIIREGNLTAIDYLNTSDLLIGGQDGNVIGTNGNAPVNYTQQMRSSSLMGTIEQIYSFTQDRSVALVNQNNIKELHYTTDGGQTWVAAPGSMTNPTVSLIQKTPSKLELLLTDATTVNRFIFNLTGSPFIIDQTSSTPLPGNFVATTTLIDGSQTYYFGVGTSGNVYRSNPLANSSSEVSFNLIATIPSADTKKIDVKKLNTGDIYIGILSSTGAMQKLVSPSVTGTYTMGLLNPPTTFTNANYTDFTFADLSGIPHLLAYDKQNNRLGKVLVQATAGNQNFTAINLTIGAANAPGVGEINAIAFKNNQVTAVGLNGGIYTTAAISSSATTVVLNPRKSMRSTPLNEVKNSSSTLLVVGDNGRLLQRFVSGASTYWKTIQVSTTSDLNDLGSLTGQTIVAGDNSTLFSIDLGTLNKTNFTTNTGLTVPIAVNGINFNAVETILNQTYIVGDNGTLLYSDNPLTNAFAVGNSQTNENFIGACLIPSQTGLQQRVIVVGTSAHVYRYKGVTGTETKEVFGPTYKDVHFANGQMGTFVGNHFAVRTTNNGGLSWTIELPTVITQVTGNLNSINKTWTVPSVNGDHFALIVGNNYSATIHNNIVTNAPYTQNIQDIQFSSNSPLNGFVASGSNLRKVVLSPSANGYNVTFGTSYPTATAVRAIHIFENQTVMLVGDNLINYFNGTSLLNALSGQSGNFRDVYFHDNTEGYVVGESGKFLQVISTNNDPITHQIIVAGLQYAQKSLLDNVIAANNNVDLKAIAFGSRVKGVWGGKYLGPTFNTQPIPYVRLIKDESNEITARFFYDRLGRIVVSQNSRQFGASTSSGIKYSYSLYDELGRVYEAGEKTENSGSTIKFKDILGTYVNGLFVSSVIDDADLSSWLTTQSVSTRKEVTKSYYDQSNPVIASQFPSGFVPDPISQRKRVVHMTYEENYDNNDATYDNATHYDYNIHGDVKTLLQDNKKLENITDIAQHRFKRFDYNYDLISGNVHRLDYQTGNADQWHHAYEYDADNRITDVYTTNTTPLTDPQFGQTSSQNESMLTPYWDKEANYAYYQHGPLARTELGAEKVQGIDNVYTLKGWIKSVNSNNLDPQNDPGKDGLGLGINYNVARDVYGFSLHYYNGDYNGVIPANEGFIANQTGSDLTTNSSNLFNGNISKMVTTITDPNSREVLPLGNAYRYDQLQRLTESKSFTNLNGNNWEAGQNIKYYNAFTYDANGNITHQVRQDENGILIDDLDYGYNKVNNKVVQNRLYQVDDGQINGSAYSDDIDDMPNIILGSTINTDNNYTYDEEGRLIKNLQEEISLILWRVDGKVNKIIRTTGSNKKNLSFEYNAQGHRIAKHVFNSQNQLEKSTYYLLDGKGNTISIYERIVNITNQSITYEQIEKHIYGNSRLGVMKMVVPLLGSQNIIYSTINKKHIIGQRTYELTNHLGNVLSIISDKPVPHINGSIIDYYNADLRHSGDFSAFGVELKARSVDLSGADQYRYGYQGSEKDNEIMGEGNSYTTFFRLLDSRLGRWLTPDPVVHHGQTPYCSMDNSPNYYCDELGANGEVKVTKDSNGENMNLSNHVIIYNADPANITAARMNEVKQALENQVAAIGSDPSQNFQVENFGNLRVSGTVTVIFASSEEEALKMALDLCDGNVFGITTTGETAVETSGQYSHMKGMINVTRSMGGVGSQDYRLAHEWLHLFGLEDRYTYGIKTTADGTSLLGLGVPMPVQVPGDGEYHRKDNQNIMVDPIGGLALSKMQIEYLFSHSDIKGYSGFSPTQQTQEFINKFVNGVVIGEVDLFHVWGESKFKLYGFYGGGKTNKVGRNNYNKLNTFDKQTIDANVAP